VAEEIIWLAEIVLLASREDRFLGWDTSASPWPTSGDSREAALHDRDVDFFLFRGRGGLVS
jgi:hypothetical protein